MATAKRSYQNRTWKMTGSETGSPDRHESGELKRQSIVVYGDNRPNWRQLIANGDDATTSMDGIQSTVRGLGHGRYNMTWSGGSQKRDVIGDLYGPDIATYAGAPSDTTAMEQARTQAISKLVRNYRSKSRSFQGGVFAGELIETARMLASPARSLRKATSNLVQDMRHVFTGRRLSKRGRQSAIADTYLEWVFGVKPLVADLDDAATAFRRITAGERIDHFPISGEGSAQRSSVGYRRDFTGIPGFTLNGLEAYVTVVEQYDCKIRGSFKSSNPSGDMPLPMIIGTSLSDVLPTTWELIPWSFLVDYFVNIGEVLDGWSMRLVNFSWLNQTVRNSRTVTIGKGNARPPSWTTLSVETAPSKSFYKTVLRESISNTQLTPSVQVELPFGSTSKSLNIAALLASTRRPPHR